jgi:hypothetical protein
MVEIRADLERKKQDAIAALAMDADKLAERVLQNGIKV